jgi:hypothetical protein
MSPDQILDDLTYRQYRISRESSPDITPRSWGFVYGPVWEALEERYQRDAARGQGKVPLLPYQAHGVRAMVSEALRFIESTEIRDAWQDSDAEITGLWEEDGCWFRIRPDILSVDRRVHINYKTTTDASPEAFSRQLSRMGYDFSDAFYRRGIQQITGRDPTSLLLAQSTEPPYECSLHGCHETLREIADARVEEVIALWKQCMKSNKWPSYGSRVHWAIPASWQIKEHEERMAA